MNKNYRYYTILLSFVIFFASSSNNILYALSQSDLQSTPPSLWQRFWRNNQQIAGEKLKRQSNSYTNPEIFSSPKWQAAAEYQNKNYKKSEELLQNLDLDSNTHTRYNYANSLAMQGKITEAIENYNKILAKDTTNQDALFNKQLLEKYLKSKEQNKNQEQNQEQNKDNSNDAKNDQDQGQDKNQLQNNNQDNKTQKQDKQKSDTSDDKQNNDNKSANGDNTQENKKQQTSTQQENKQNRSDTNNLTPEAQYQQNQVKKNDNNQSDQQQDIEKADTVTKNDPELEKWLDKIPDNPAMYLKNQLQYEYLLEQQANKN